jgi:seryl-tRNA synthetase
MIDLRRLRNAPDEVRANLARREIDLSELDQVIHLDEEVRRLSSERDTLRSKVKGISKLVGEAHKSGDKERAGELARESKEMGAEEARIDEQVGRFEAELRSLLLVIPNEISQDVPYGSGEQDNPIVIEAEERSWQDHQRVPHWEIGQELGILDSERAVRMSGSMFNMLRGAGATLSRALCQYALDLNADAWEEVRPPSLVKTETMISTGHLPKFEDDGYAIERDELWTIPTAEVPLTSMAKDEIVDEAQLPWKMMAHTPCFRREAGSAGKDTRGLLRVHEFDKVELMAYATPEQGEQIMFEIRDRSLKAFRSLGLQVRVIEICSGDLGRSHHRSFDIEAYAPGCDQWLEVSSCSWYSDYQARRANARYKPTGGGSNQILHTCNGTALAVPRAFAAVVETHRQPDGTVAVPEVLRPYMRGIDKIVPR